MARARVRGVPAGTVAGPVRRLFEAVAGCSGVEVLRVVATLTQVMVVEVRSVAAVRVRVVRPAVLVAVAQVTGAPTCWNVWSRSRRAWSTFGPSNLLGKRTLN